MDADFWYGFFGWLALLAHASTSLRARRWMPGHSLPEGHWSIPLRIALSNLYYASLMFWLALYVLNEYSWWLRSALLMGVAFTFIQWFRHSSRLVRATGG